MGTQEQKTKATQLQRLRRRLDGHPNPEQVAAVLKALLELLEGEL